MASKTKAYVSGDQVNQSAGFDLLGESRVETQRMVDEEEKDRKAC